MTLFIAIILTGLGWFVSILLNHAANAIPLRESLAQVPFCKRLLIEQVLVAKRQGQEFISIGHKDASSPPSPQYCHAPLPWPQWSATLAYLTQQRHCHRCNKAIGLRAVLVELLIPIAFVFLYNTQALSVYLVFLYLYTALLILLLTTDLEHRLIQNVIILPAVLSALVGAFFTPTFSWRQAIVGGALGLIVFYVLALLSRGGLGSGDVTLAAFLGLITGFPNVILVIFLGIFLGGLVSAILLVTRLVTLRTYIPYGPFLMLAGWVVLIWGDSLFQRLWG